MSAGDVFARIGAFVLAPISTLAGSRLDQWLAILNSDVRILGKEIAASNYTNYAELFTPAPEGSDTSMELVSRLALLALLFRLVKRLPEL